MPKGRGLDGVYENPRHLQPPKYTITETKYREGGRYIDSDGSASDSALSMTKNSGKQMSSTWINNHLRNEFKDNPYLRREIEEEGYVSLLMIVDETGKVVAISKLNSAGRTIQGIRP